MTRQPLPKTTRQVVLNEFNHRCAICGSDHPQIHHIDEDNSNNDPENLLPLCPNCHLSDQHNPTRKLDIFKLRLFRKYKDPAILKPQFHPIFTRLAFLEFVDGDSIPAMELPKLATELIAFIKALDMGEFYGNKVSSFIGNGYGWYPRDKIGTILPQFEAAQNHVDSIYRKQFVDHKNEILDLIIEQLRYQNWP